MVARVSTTNASLRIQVKALEVAEALKRKEAAKAAQRAKMKEDILKQKAERNKVRGHRVICFASPLGRFGVAA